MPRLPSWLSLLPLVALALVVAAYAAGAAFHVAFGAMNIDEGFYAAAARSVWQGEVPYRDFGFTQPPLVAYVNGLVLGLTRFGLFEQRIVNGVWAALALALGGWWLARRHGLGRAALFIALFALTPGWLYPIHLGKTYGLLSLLVMLAATIYVETPRGRTRCFGLSILLVLGIACRLPSVPFFGVLWIAALFDESRPRTAEIALALAGVVGAGAVFLLPFYLAAPEASVFWTVDFHRVSVPEREWRLGWEALLTFAPAVWCVAAFAFGRAARLRSWPRREAILAGAAIVALATNCLPRGAYQEYGAPFLLPLAFAALRQPAAADSRWTWRRRAALLAGLVAIAIGLGPAVNWRLLGETQRNVPSAWLPVSVPPYDYGLPAGVRQASLRVAQLLPEGQPFVGPNLILAIEANRPIPRRLRMSSFSITEDFPREKADRLHLLTFSELRSMLSDIDLPVLGFTQVDQLNYSWSVPTFHFLAGEDEEALHRLVNRYFVTVYSDRNFAVVARPHILPLVPR